MTRWDYMILSDAVEIHSEGRLDELGAAGWELAGFDPRGIAFFKRPWVQQAAEPAAKPSRKAK